MVHCVEVFVYKLWIESLLWLRTQEPTSSQHFYDHHWLTLTFDPVTCSMSSLSREPGNDYCDRFH